MDSQEQIISERVGAESIGSTKQSLFFWRLSDLFQRRMLL
jgi:hypothetical protein